MDDNEIENLVNALVLASAGATPQSDAAHVKIREAQSLIQEQAKKLLEAK